MQFKIAKSYLYWWPVTVHMPDPANPGQFLKQEMKLQLEPQTRDEAITSSEALANMKTAREMIDHEIDEHLKIIRNWDGVVDEGGGPMPFSPEALKAAMQHTWFRKAISKAIAESLGGEAARLGN